ncbi:hypothetical protein QFC21_000137 [Naganishia friedmannii]|uniref:Uncharacterized protein n=1 Tax=Naganishia friedmannii TaxID=89922 RepID=A0ACC2WB07_9TREE|nr:hypothetical protein QFC21_000137 [Naganishia friedmannii]
MCNATVSDNLLVAYAAPSHGCSCHRSRPPVVSLDLPTRGDLDVTVVLGKEAKDIESKRRAVSRSSSSARRTAYTSARKNRYSGAQIAVGRNHVHWILGAMLAFFSFTMLEVARTALLSLAGLQFGPDFLSLDQYANFEATSLMGDAVYEFGWISIATSLWLTMSCLDSVLSGIIPNDSCAFFNTAIVEVICTSTLAGAWISRLVNHAGLFQLFWTSTTINPRTEWMVYLVFYLAVCNTSLLLLNAIWIAQAVLTKAQEQELHLWVVALQEVNELARGEDDDQEVELLEDAEGGFINYDQYLYWDKR